MRHSSFIRRQQVTNVNPAIRLAEKNGTPLNRFVTLSFAHTACEAEAVSIAFSELRARFVRWFRRRQKGGRRLQAEASFVWAIENANGYTAAHWLVHIPPAMLAEFRTRLPAWLAKVTGGIHCEASAIDIKPARTPIGAGKYMMKGIDPAYADFYRIRHVPQGDVYGKRCGFSQNLGPTSCRRERTYYRQIIQDRARQAARAMSESHSAPAPQGRYVDAAPQTRAC